MLSVFSVRGLPRIPRPFLLIFGAFLVLVILYYRHLLYLLWTLVSLPMNWAKNAEEFTISLERDNFDVTFANYTMDQTTAGTGYEDVVPPLLHHIMLGDGPMRPVWEESRQTCRDWHPDWEEKLWTDKMADELIEQKYPEFREVWDAYKYPIERVDALRYLILYEYGGVILDLDVQCKRSLGPLRRFGFVAPAAHPTGFSVSFMMTAAKSRFIRIIIDNLGDYNRNWLGLPYVAVMFSTGGHFASALHVLQADRSPYKILAGPAEHPALHSLNGAVTTPLFRHLGSSSWHSFDGQFITSLGQQLKKIGIFALVTIVCIAVIVRWVCVRRRKRWLVQKEVDLEELDKREV